jgi:hypothetical protein
MDCKSTYKKIFSFLFFLCCSVVVFGQAVTRVNGTVTDAGTKKPIPFANVAFTGSSIGTNTGESGKYSLLTNKSYTQIKVSSVGYKDAFLTVVPGKEQIVNVKLFPAAKQLQEVVIKTAKKPKYRNKDNPAVELIRQVIAHREKNRPESYDYVEYKEYDKMMFSFSDVSDSLSKKKFFRKYKFIIDNRDSTSVPGKSLLPIYLNEKLSQNYYRKDPKKKKTIVLGEKGVDFGGSIDSEGIGQYFKHMYADVDIYSNNIFLITSNFLSPISSAAPAFYKFFITDTITENNQKLVELSFTPRNTYDILFEGKIYITLDGNYAVQKASLTTNKNINLNFVKTMHVDQDFEQNPDGRYHLSRSNMMADFGVKKNQKGGLFGIRTVTFKNYAVNKPQPDNIYSGPDVVVNDESKERSTDFWDANRLDTLSTAESKVYTNIDSLKRMPSYRRTMDIATLLLAGYKQVGPFEIGPANTFYSFNPIEGFRLRFGGRSTTELSKRFYFETYAAYGFKDEKWKYFLSGTYSINNKSIYRFPQNYIRASFQRDTKIPGSNLQFVQEDNFLLSFKRGENDKYLYNDFYRLDYVHEFENHFSYALGLHKLTQTPAGSLYFINTVDGMPNNVSNLTTTEATLRLRYAPHEGFYQGKLYRAPIPNQYPIFTLDFTQGFKGVFEGEYNYQNVRLQIDKRFYLSQLGFADVRLEGGRIFGQVPYPLLTIHRANQTYAYDLYSYNLMNFLEFVSDHYEAINIDQHFQGFFFNKIPLFKKLKWREVASVKAVFGGVSDRNDPSLHPNLYQFPVDDQGQPITYTLDNRPYVEGSVGIENIFKFIRADLVRRFNYLDHPNTQKWGFRIRIRFDF